ncbi:MAG TPA: hypothetical protein VHJ99_01290 [Candidatus Dormibacteraeota bacterium]|nr:hypothetical protein [Candidatus Dormibacteraeota bacterium]
MVAIVDVPWTRPEASACGAGFRVQGMGGVDGAIAGRAARVLAMECLLIPSEELVGVAQPDESHGHLKLDGTLVQPRGVI